VQPEARDGALARNMSRFVGSLTLLVALSSVTSTATAQLAQR
jgi:hypothetical protein